MNQKDISDIVILEVVNSFPQLKNTQTVREDYTIDVKLKSIHGKITLWLTTQNSQITIGFNVAEGKFDWHTHIDVLNREKDDRSFKEAINIINSIITDKSIIIYSSILGYFPTDNDEGIYEYKQEDEIIEVYRWSDL